MNTDKEKETDTKTEETEEVVHQAENGFTDNAETADDGKTADTTESVLPDAKPEVDAAAADIKQHYLRLQADFANYKKRTAGEKMQISEIVKMDVLKNILPIIDNFERALQAPQDTASKDLQSFIDGYAMIYKQLMAVLEKEGVTKISAVGKPFDPVYHQAVMRMPSDTYENDIVVEVLQEGYLLGDKTLRPAMVKVAFNG